MDMLGFDGGLTKPNIDVSGFGSHDPTNLLPYMYVPTNASMTDLNVGANVTTTTDSTLPTSEISSAHDPAAATNILQAAVQSITTTDGNNNTKQPIQIEPVSDEDWPINIDKQHEF